MPSLPNFPLAGHFTVRDLKTDLVHVAQSYDNGYIASLVVFATWCSIELDRDWRLEHQGVVTCLECCANPAD